MDNRISNRDSASPGAAADSTRRAERRSEDDARERAERFKRTLGRERAGEERQAERAEARTSAHGQAGRAQEQESRGTRQRDQAVAAEVLGRLGLESETKAGGKPSTVSETTRPAEQAQAESTGTGATAGSGEAAPGRGAGPDLKEEINVIEKAAEQVLEKSEALRSAEDQSTAPLEEALPHLAPWARPEGPSQVPHAPRELPAPPPGAEAYHRLLMGQGPLGAEARLAITQGPLAGLQIHLSQGPQGLKAAVLTQGASSRQTLTSAMDEVARRLRDKGHHLEVKWSAGTGGSSLPGGGSGTSSR